MAGPEVRLWGLGGQGSGAIFALIIDSQDGQGAAHKQR